MKKLVLLIAIVLAAYVGFGQATPSGQLRVAAFNTVFGVSFPGFGTTHNKAANGDHTHAPVPSPVNTYEIEAAADGANNWTVPFTLRSTTTIIYNSMPIGSSRWTGVGTTTLSVILDTRKNDKLVIIN